MVSRIWKLLACGVVLVALSGSLGIAFASDDVEVVADPIFMAGEKSGPGGAICSCPVRAGNCVCQINPQ